MQAAANGAAATAPLDCGPTPIIARPTTLQRQGLPTSTSIDYRRPIVRKYLKKPENTGLVELENTSFERNNGVLFNDRENDSSLSLLAVVFLESIIEAF